MRSLTFWLVILIDLILAIAGIADRAKASDIRLLDLEKFDMEYYKIDTYRDNYAPYAEPNQPGESWKDGAAVDFNLTLAAYKDYRLYLDNHVHMEDTDVQVRHVGWQWEAGFDLDKANLFWYHHSQHVLDDSIQGRQYPLENFYGLRVIFYERRK